MHTKLYVVVLHIVLEGDPQLRVLGNIPELV
jgi:hypothetical protein